MKLERLGSPSDFAKLLAAHLATIAQPRAPLPADADLAALVDAAFFASLHEEEARRLDFTIAWQPHAHRCVAVIELAAPVRATPANLVKIAPATLHDATAIAVRRDGDALVAWALLEREPHAYEPLTIHVLSAGVLRVDYAGTPRALYARGELLFLGGAHRAKSPAERLTRTFACWSTTSPVHPRAAVITQLAARARGHGHGGMILVVPAEVASPIGVRMHYGLAQGAALLQRPAPDLAVAVDRVARLTAIDNALLLDTDLRVRGFGVQVVAGDAPKLQFEHINPYSDDTHIDDLSTFKGTRHPAGVIFCMRQDTEAAAIIASQDGHLSLVTRDTRGAVTVLGTYEHAFGWDAPDVTAS